MKLVDLSHTISHEMPLFSPDAPRPSVRAWQSHAQSAASGRYLECTCEITEVKFITSLGTYLDNPFHFHPGEPTIENLELEQLVLPGVVVDCTSCKPNQPVGPEFLKDIEVQDRAVLFHAGWSRYWGDAEYHQHPHLTFEVALTLVEMGAKLAGVDWLVVDDTQNPRRPVHVTLLERGILIVENLTNLEMLPETGFTFHAVPIKIAGAAAFPVRAYASIWDRREKPSS